MYLVTNRVNGKAFGQTSASVERRWIQHRSDANKGSRVALHNAMRKYGEDNFSIVVLEEVRGCRADLLQAEVRQISARGTLSPKGYNLTSGGEGVDFTNPKVQENHRRAVAQSAAWKRWRAAQFEGARKRLADPKWRQANAKAVVESHSCPEYRARVSAERREYFSDPQAKKDFLAAIERRSESSWKDNHRAAMLRLHQDPSYIAKRDAGLRKAAEGRMQAAVERDQSYPPEVAAERARKREQRRQRRQRRQRMAARRAAAQGSV